MRTRFETKILWTIFITTALVGLGLVTAAYLLYSRSVREEFFDRYSSLNRMLGKSIVEAEKAAEITMRDAAYVIQDRDTRPEPLSLEELRKLVGQTGITHAFLINREGTFIRSTNEDPKLIPNLFSFCSEYREIFDFPHGIEATPIIPPTPEPKPYKFLSVPNLAKSRIIHIGLRVDFIAELLKDVLNEDANITKIAIFAPNGVSLGSFGANERDFDRVVDPDVTNSDEGFKEEKDSFKISNWIESAHPLDCQARTLNNTRNGRYDYLIRSSVSNRAIMTAQASAFRFALIAIFAAFIFSFFLARLLSRKIVYRLRHLAEQARNIHSSSEALQINGTDEVFELGKALNELLLNLQKAEAQLIESAKQKSLADLAKHVAHDIRSPLAALNVVSSLIKDIPEAQREMIQAAIERISRIADDLLQQSKTKVLSSENIEEVVAALIREKEMEFGEKFPGLEIQVKMPSQKNVFVKMNRHDFQRCLSNLMNNAAEASPAKGTVRVDIATPIDHVEIRIVDQGKGIPPDVLARLGKEQVSAGKVDGTGIGFLFCRRTIESFGGKIDVFSEPGRGTLIVIRLPAFRS